MSDMSMTLIYPPCYMTADLIPSHDQSPLVPDRNLTSATQWTECFRPKNHLLYLSAVFCFLFFISISQLLTTNKEPGGIVCLQLWLTNNLSSVVIFQRSDALSH